MNPLTPISANSVKLHRLAEQRSTTESDRLQRRIMLFDLSIHGHHPAYIRHLIEYWDKQSLPGYLDIVVSSKFLSHHADVVNLATRRDHPQVQFVPIAPEVEARFKSRKSGLNRTIRAFQEWQVLCEVAQTLKADHCVILYFDTCQLPLAVWQHPPCPVSGIYFKPTFHYPALHDSALHDSGLKPSHVYRPQQWQQWREKRLLAQVLQHPRLHRLFCLDPLAVKSIELLDLAHKVIPLPDPVPLTPVTAAQVDRLRSQTGIQAGRQVFLLFGALNGRKGIYQLLDSIALLPAAVHDRLCLLLVGEANPQEQSRINAEVAEICQTTTMQIITHYEYVPESDVQAYFHLADLVLAPYQRHVGMSGILLLAAAAQKPVLSSNYGLMGELVRRYHLGLAIDSTQPSEIAQGILQFLSTEPDLIGNTATMKTFAEQNSVEQFAATIFNAI